VFLVSNKWQVDFAFKIQARLGESFSLAFVFEDEAMLGDSKFWIEKVGTFPIVSILDLRVISWQSEGIINKLTYQKGKKIPKIFFVTLKEKGVSARKFVNLSAYCNGQLIICQHGENFSINESFNWREGWVISSKLSFFRSFVDMVVYKFVAHPEKRINANCSLLTLMKNNFFCYADVICVLLKKEETKVKHLLNFKSNIFNIGSITRRNIDRKGNIDSLNFHDKALLLTAGALKVNAEDALYSQIQVIKFVYEICEEQNKDLVIKYKPAEKHRLSLIRIAAPKAKLVQDMDIETICQYRYLFLPADSGACIEASYFRRRYSTYLVYKRAGNIAKINNINNVINFFHLEQSEKESKILLLTYLKRAIKKPVNSEDFFDKGLDDNFEEFLMYLKKI
jgi:hypothetical protein